MKCAAVLTLCAAVFIALAPPSAADGPPGRFQLLEVRAFLGGRPIVLRIDTQTGAVSKLVLLEMPLPPQKQQQGIKTTPVEGWFPIAESLTTSQQTAQEFIERLPNAPAPRK